MPISKSSSTRSTLIGFLECRIGDRRVLRLIRNWLEAGVSEDGEVTEASVSTPQGAVLSPLLSNVYLHYVFDLWTQWWRESRLDMGEDAAVRPQAPSPTHIIHPYPEQRFRARLKAGSV